MTGAEFLSLAPLALTGLAGIAGMALAPVAPVHAVRGVTAALMALALVVALSRAGADAAAPYALMIDDGLARFGTVLALLAGLGVLAFARAEGGAREAPALVAIATAGAVALAGAAHAAVLFLGLEITTLAMIALALLPRTAEATEAGYKLFLMAGAGAAALLLGLAFGFAGSGSLMIDAWPGGGTVAAVGGALVFAGLAFKFSLVPFHMWTPDLFAGAPAPAAALAGAVSKVAVGIALLRLTEAAPGGDVWPLALALAGGAAAIFGNLVALRQESLARMLGYSTIAHSGYLALMLAAGGALTGEALLVYLAAYVPAILAALCVAAALGPVTRDDLRGLVHRQPLAGAALALALLSMAGLPPTAGFVGKVYLFSALAAAEAWALLAAAAVGAALAFVYYLRFAVAAFASAEGAPGPALGWPARAALVVALAALIGPGLYPEPLIALASAAALP